MASKALRFHPQRSENLLTALSSYVMGIASAVQLRQSILKTPLVRRSKKSEKLRSAGRSTSWISENILSGNFPSALCIRSFLLGSWSLRWLTGEGSPDIGGIVFEANVPSVPDSPVPESPPPNKNLKSGRCPVLVPAFFAGTGRELDLSSSTHGDEIAALSQRTRQERGTRPLGLTVRRATSRRREGGAPPVVFVLLAGGSIYASPGEGRPPAIGRDLGYIRLKED